jgi:hypothetical protein
MQKQPEFLHPDGTSQANRTQRALDPGYVSVDERSVKDLLVFAQKYAEELRYFNEHDEADGEWKSFLGETNLDEIVAYLNDPQRIPADSQLLRPHLVLFLTFLELLQVARAQLNDLTRRHLEFYYREALRLTSQKGVPDRVHTLVELADRQDQFLLPAGSLLRAGQDSLGNDLFYRSDEDLVANRASVESLKSLFADRQIIGIREARQSPDLVAELFPINKDRLAQGVMSERSFMAMLVMALGTPGPGGLLPEYFVDRHVTVSASLLDELDKLLEFVQDDLYMPFSTFRSLIQFKQEQEQTEKQWQQVNDIIENAGKNRDANFRLDRSQPDNFEKNLLAALGLPKFGTLFNGLPEVDDVYDLYRRIKNTEVIEAFKPDGNDLVPKKFLYMTLDTFAAMMKIVEEINARWRQIYEILRAAGRKKQASDYKFEPPMIRTYDADKFGTLVRKTLGTIEKYPKIAGMQLNSFDDCHREIVKLENYFHMTAEEFDFIRKINEKQEASQPWERDQVYAILEDAHTEKEIVDRRNTLEEKRKKDFETMIRFALGDPEPGNLLPDSKVFKDLNPKGNKSDESYVIEKLFLEPANFQYIKDTEAKGEGATKEEWANVYIILEKAQRRKRGLGAARAEIEKWNNIYVAADATQVQTVLAAEGESATPRWRTFGEGYAEAQPDGKTRTIPGNIGFAIASPLLALAEGTRTITLTIAFDEKRYDKETMKLAIEDPSPFRFLLSSEKEMVEIRNVGATKNVSIQLLDAEFNLSGAEKPYKRALQIKLTLNEQTPAIAPLTVQALIQTPWPVLQIMLADIPTPRSSGGSEGGVKRYRAFQNLMLEKLYLSVDVEGITTLTLQNDNGLLDPKKPFEPFGASPVVGSSFYIAHPEICSKRLDGLSLKIDWLGAPEDLSAHYLGYKDYADVDAAPASPILNNTSFKASLKLYDNRSFFNISELQLFNATKATQTNQVTINAKAIIDGYPGYQQDIHPVIAPEALDWHRYWKLELLPPDFQHTLYPRAAAGCATKKKPYIVNPPYTPKIKRLSMNYSAWLEIDLTKTDLNAQVDKLYHIEPFGYLDLAGYTPPTPPSLPETGEKARVAFLPQYENDGELFIGIKNLSEGAPQNLSLLFQMAEGSADPDLPQEKIEWHFLDANQWRSLQQGRLLSDTTNGLLNSGIIKFDLSPVQAGTRLPADLYWIRAAIGRNSRSVADIVAIKAQAVSATFIDRGNAPDHLSQPLPAGSITGLAETQPAIQAIHQPYSSFGGKSPEQANSFYIRASERLRHKNRALTCWDYEHMVLEAFPGIFKVKCLPVGTSEDPRLADVIQVIIIPDIKGKLPFDPFEPKAPADVLFQIEQYLARQCAPLAHFKVKNPIYLRLQVRLGVRLRPGANPGYYRSILNEELQRYLAPWAYDRSAEIVFGGAINTSLIINFVEERPYIDYVAGIKLFIITPDGLTRSYNPTDKGPSFGPDAIIVSDRSHQIDLITEEGYEAEYFTGINYMKIELDFQIATG